MELPIFSKNDRPVQIISHDILPVVALAFVLLLTFWTRQTSDLPPNALPMHWNIDHRVPSYQRERNGIPKHPQWTTVWPTVVRFDRPVI
jgi:hypothetical protein